MSIDLAVPKHYLLLMWMKISHTLKLINFSLYVLHYTLVDREQGIYFLITKHVALESHELFFSNVHYFRLSLIQFACNGVGPPWLVSMTISGVATPMQVKWIKLYLICYCHHENPCCHISTRVCMVHKCTLQDNIWEQIQFLSFHSFLNKTTTSAVTYQ